MDWKLGAFLVGLIVGLVIATGIGVLVSGYPTTWDFDEFVLVPLIGGAAGLLAGSELWKHAKAKAAVDKE